MAEGAGDVEEEGGKMVGTPTANDADDVKALHAIKEGLEDTTNVPGIVAVRPPTQPRSPTPPKPCRTTTTMTPRGVLIL